MRILGAARPTRKQGGKSYRETRASLPIPGHILPAKAEDAPEPSALMDALRVPPGVERRAT